jgi:hypothetical protein
MCAYRLAALTAQGGPKLLSFGRAGGQVWVEEALSHRAMQPRRAPLILQKREEGIAAVDLGQGVPI